MHLVYLILEKTAYADVIKMLQLWILSKISIMIVYF